MTDEDLIKWDAGLDLIWQELFYDAKVFLRELTVGYMGLIDEAWLADKAKKARPARRRVSGSTSPADDRAISW